MKSQPAMLSALLLLVAIGHWSLALGMQPSMQDDSQILTQTVQSQEPQPSQASSPPVPTSIDTQPLQDSPPSNQTNAPLASSSLSAEDIQKVEEKLSTLEIASEQTITTISPTPNVSQQLPPQETEVAFPQQEIIPSQSVYSPPPSTPQQNITTPDFPTMTIQANNSQQLSQQPPAAPVVSTSTPQQNISPETTTTIPSTPNTFQQLPPQETEVAFPQQQITPSQSVYSPPPSTSQQNITTPDFPTMTIQANNSQQLSQQPPAAPVVSTSIPQQNISPEANTTIPSTPNTSQQLPLQSTNITQNNQAKSAQYLVIHHYEICALLNQLISEDQKRTLEISEAIRQILQECKHNVWNDLVIPPQTGIQLRQTWKMANSSIKATHLPLDQETLISNFAALKKALGINLQLKTNFPQNKATNENAAQQNLQLLNKIEVSLPQNNGSLDCLPVLKKMFELMECMTSPKHLLDAITKDPSRITTILSPQFYFVLEKTDTNKLNLYANFYEQYAPLTVDNTPQQ